jgi:hypothetical protein
LLAGQFTTDSRPGVLAFYNYGSDELAAWLFPGGGSGVSREQFRWRTGTGMWNWNSM